MVALTHAASKDASALREQIGGEQLAAAREAICKHFADMMNKLATQKIQRKGEWVPQFSPLTMLAACLDFDALVFERSEAQRTHGKVWELVCKHYSLLEAASQGSGILEHYEWCNTYKPSSSRLHKARQDILSFL